MDHLALPALFELGESEQNYMFELLNTFGPAVVGALVAVVIAAWQANEALKTYFRQKKIEAHHASVSELYDPILALMLENGELFSKVGPASFPNDHNNREIAAKVWMSIRPKILENNRAIRKILIDRSAKINAEDSLSNYQELIVHLSMYESTQNLKSDIMERFRFPEKIVAHVKNTKARLQQEILELSR